MRSHQALRLGVRLSRTAAIKATVAGAGEPVFALFDCGQEGGELARRASTVADRGLVASLMSTSSSLSSEEGCTG